MNTLASKLDGFVHDHHDVVLRAALAFYAVAGLAFIWLTIGKDVGFEPVIIARALAEGHGYSFPFEWAWLCTPLCEKGLADGAHLTTAWADPLFTLYYAGLISAFGEETARIIVRPLHLAFFCIAVFLTAMTARRLAGPWAALIAVGFLLVATKHHATAINAASIATLWISLICYWLVRFADEMTTQRAALLGGFLALSALTWGSTILFIPIAVLLILLRNWFTRDAVVSAAVIAVVALSIISPWTIRNYVAFDQLVPVRNGIGQVAWIGTIGVTGTFKDGVTDTDIPPPWTSNGPGNAIGTIVGTEGADPLLGLERWQEQVIDAQSLAEPNGFNEAVRDKWLFAKARSFILEQPITAIQLAFYKVNAFVMRVDFPVPHTDFLRIAIGIITYLSLIAGVLLAIQRVELWGPVLLAGGFMVPFAIITPYYYRYRQPIEPVVSILVAISLVMIVQWARRYIEESRKSSIAGDQVI